MFFAASVASQSLQATKMIWLWLFPSCLQRLFKNIAEFMNVESLMDGGHR